MGEKTEIAWCDSTHNEWLGCMKVSAGCDNCYAEGLLDNWLHRVEWGQRKTEDGPPPSVGTRSLTSEANRRKPFTWNRKAAEFQASHGRRQRVFCSSLSDVFDNQVPRGWRIGLFHTIENTPELDWLLLTKRPENIGDMIDDCGWFKQIPRNVWLGTTCEDQAAYDKRWPILARFNVRVRFISYEPAIGPLDISPLMGDKPVHEKQAQRGLCLSGSSERRLGDYAGRDDLASPQENLGFRQRQSSQHAMQENPSGERLREISSGQDHDGRGENLRSRASSGLASLQGTHTGRPDGESRSRKEEGERSGELGISNPLGANPPCAARPESRPDRPELRKECYVKIDSNSGQRDSSATGSRRKTPADSSGLRNHVPSGLQDSQSRSLGYPSWIIAGGESGRGFRHADPDWFRKVRNDCEHHGIPFFMKQMPGLKPIPEDLMIRQFPPGLKCNP